LPPPAALSHSLCAACIVDSHSLIRSRGRVSQSPTETRWRRQSWPLRRAAKWKQLPSSTYRPTLKWLEKMLEHDAKQRRKAAPPVLGNGRAISTPPLDGGH